MIEKIEEEVEYEGVMEEMWLNMRADEESWEMEQRKQDFQVESATKHNLRVRFGC